MLKLIQSIFGGGELRGRYPESLIEAAIGRAVDGTDPRLRALMGYKKSLRPSILHAIDHVVSVVDSLPAPLSVGRSDYSADLRLKALFASADHMLEVFGDDAELSKFRSDSAYTAERIIALLLAERAEKNVLGMEIEGDLLRRDVAQVAVSFHSHRLLEPASNEADTRLQLKRRAFDHLLTLALTRITEAHSERADLARQRDLLCRKLSALKRGGWSFDADEGERSEPATLLAELQEIETELASPDTDKGVLQTHLDIVVDLLEEAEQQLWVENLILHLDRMNIKRDAQDVLARGIPLQELHNARGQHAVLLMISLVPAELPAREDFITAAERYL
jgi:hypothetical protein